jgi:hypothetical protein
MIHSQKNIKIKVILFPILLISGRAFLYFEIFQASPTRPSDKSSKMARDRNKPNYLEQIVTSPIRNVTLNVPGSNSVPAARDLY